MKKVKYIISALVIALCVMIPGFALVGCKRHYNISVEVVEGYGKVTPIDKFEKNLIGSNDVEEGAVFECSVVPQTGYQIKYIEIDGAKILNPGISDVEEDRGNISRSIDIDPVVANHTIKIAFEKRTYHLTFAYGNLESNKLVDGDGKAIERTGKYKDTFESIIANFDNGHFYWAGESDPDEYGKFLLGTNEIQNDMLLITDLSETQLKELLGIVD